MDYCSFGGPGLCVLFWTQNRKRGCGNSKIIVEARESMVAGRKTLICQEESSNFWFFFVSSKKISSATEKLKKVKWEKNRIIWISKFCVESGEAAAKIGIYVKFCLRKCPLREFYARLLYVGIALKISVQKRLFLKFFLFYCF